MYENAEGTLLVIWQSIVIKPATLYLDSISWNVSFEQFDVNILYISHCIGEKTCMVPTVW